VTAALMFRLARAGWIVAAWCLLRDNPQGVTIGLALIVTHLWLGPVEICVAPEPKGS
jgi:hypothetical protein